MKLTLALIMLTAPQIGEAQPTNRFAPEAQPFGGINASQASWMLASSNDTPTMRKQRLKRVTVFKAEVAKLLTENGGFLTADDTARLNRKARRLTYRNR